MVHSKHFSGIRRMFNKDKNNSHATIPNFLVCETLVQIENQTLAGSNGDGKSTHDLVHECSKLKNVNLGQGRVSSNKLGEEVKRSRVKNISARPSARSSAVVESNTIPGVTSSNNVLVSKTSARKSDIAESTCTIPQAELKSCLKVSSQPVPIKSTSVQGVPPIRNNDERATVNEGNENEFLPDWSISYVPLASPAPLHVPKKSPVPLLPNQSPIPSQNRLGKSNSDSMIRRVREPASSQRNVVLNNRTQQSANTTMRSPALHPCKLERGLLVAHNSAAGSRQVKRTVEESTFKTRTSEPTADILSHIWKRI
ncbi:hypothetical protein SARC_06632 [Sphaeroforma arctica JP610]|uniref:Uncharacterized protein n=1 Tax=Sphaeroforma arctica JP610 TaxID=667725 RepID=A0A0L0FYH7_9EUKA|nr:hypothetical protein SARC_06632 [Sphaeroforma arctica JP610]KNC81018.1 hypothetical protein SARC_06632 [Sphaeroforma arctica JP610]|eukprot:XP_014154920.1 hypothetical protein SARC_06632 [Sphaeroforma arctica JP610]